MLCTVTISSSSSSQIFAGFLLKAVSADQQTIVNGTFTPPNGTQTIQCQDVKGVSNMNSAVTLVTLSFAKLRRGPKQFIVQQGSAATRASL